VLEAYERVKANKGAAGVDGQSIDDFEPGPAHAGGRAPEEKTSPTPRRSPFSLLACSASGEGRAWARPHRG
jgi:hypothetical protein